MPTPIEDLKMACWSGDAPWAKRLLDEHDVSAIEIDRMVLEVSQNVDLLRLLLDRLQRMHVDPSTDVRLRLVDHFHPLDWPIEWFEEVLRRFKPTPLELGAMLERCQRAFSTRHITLDDKGNESVEVRPIEDSQKQHLERVFALALAAGAKPQQGVESLVLGMAMIGRADVADQLASSLAEWAHVAYVAFRDRSLAAQTYVKERTRLQGNVGRAALCGSVYDGNDALVTDLLALGVDPRQPYFGQVSSELPIDQFGGGARPEMLRKLVDHGARATLETLKRAVSCRNEAVLKWLLDAGVRDDQGSALMIAAVEAQPELVRALVRSQRYPLDQLTRAFHRLHESKNAEAIQAVEEAFAAQDFALPHRPGPWTLTIDLATASMPELWAEWLRFRRERLHAEDTAQPPATDAELAELSTTLNVVLPDDVQWLYRQSNGERETVPFGRGMLFGERLLSLAEIKQSVLWWQSVRPTLGDIPTTGNPSVPAGTVKHEDVNTLWMPLSDVNANHLAVDFDPDEKGVFGQIINAGRDPMNKIQLSVSLTELVRSVLRHVVLGHAEILTDAGLVFGPNRALLSDAVPGFMADGSW